MLATTTDRLGRLLLAEHDLSSLLQQVAEAARADLPGADEVSVTLLPAAPAAGPSTVAAAGRRARRLDESQYADGSGPCLTAAVQGSVERVPDTAREQRYRRFAAAARAEGVGSAASLPVPVAGDVRAALNLYASAPDGLDEQTLQLASSLADHAGATISNLQVYEQAVTTVDQLHEALRSRAVIEQAKGVLMAQHGCDPEEAFGLLQELSSRSNRKLREVAGALVESVRRRGQQDG